MGVPKCLSPGNNFSCLKKRMSFQTFIFKGRFWKIKCIVFARISAAALIKFFVRFKCNVFSRVALTTILLFSVLNSSESTSFDFDFDYNGAAAPFLRQCLRFFFSVNATLIRGGGGANSSNNGHAFILVCLMIVQGKKNQALILVNPSQELVLQNGESAIFFKTIFSPNFT